jgi:hypothetical protein
MVVVQHIPPPKRTSKIPKHLIYEELNGIALPRKGYKDVLKKKKNASEIIGSSSLQAIVVSLLHGFLFNVINRKKYWLTTNEPGVHIALGDNLSNDIAIFDKEKVNVLNDKYFSVAPEVVIEIDVKVDLDPVIYPNEFDYMVEKSQKMLDFGTERVIWFLTKSQKVFTISKSETWTVVSFSDTVKIIDDCFLNIKELLQDEGIE